MLQLMRIVQDIWNYLIAILASDHELLEELLCATRDLLELIWHSALFVGTGHRRLAALRCIDTESTCTDQTLRALRGLAQIVPTEIAWCDRFVRSGYGTPIHNHIARNHKFVHRVHSVTRVIIYKLAPRHWFLTEVAWKVGLFTVQF